MPSDGGFCSHLLLQWEGILTFYLPNMKFPVISFAYHTTYKVYMIANPLMRCDLFFSFPSAGFPSLNGIYVFQSQMMKTR